MRTLKRMLRSFCPLALALVLLFAGNYASGDSYTLDKCPVSGQKLGSMGDPIVKEYDGREVRFCCAGCPAKFEADKAKSIEKINADIVKQQAKFYPSDKCLVSGEKLGGTMGDPIDYVYQNRLVRFCCKGCIKKFESKSAEFLSKLDKAVIEKQKHDYKLDVCLVSDEKFGGDMGDPIDYVIGNRLVRLCCKSCVKQINKEPLKFLSKLDAAGKGMKSEHHEGSEEKGHGSMHH